VQRLIALVVRAETALKKSTLSKSDLKEYEALFEIYGQTDPGPVSLPFSFGLSQVSEEEEGEAE